MRALTNGPGGREMEASMRYDSWVNVFSWAETSWPEWRNRMEEQTDPPSQVEDDARRYPRRDQYHHHGRSAAQE